MGATCSTFAQEAQPQPLQRPAKKTNKRTQAKGSKQQSSIKLKAATPRNVSSTKSPRNKPQAHGEQKPSPLTIPPTEADVVSPSLFVSVVPSHGKAGMDSSQSAVMENSGMDSGVPITQSRSFNDHSTSGNTPIAMNVSNASEGELPSMSTLTDVGGGKSFGRSVGSNPLNAPPRPSLTVVQLQQQQAQPRNRKSATVAAGAGSPLSLETTDRSVVQRPTVKKPINSATLKRPNNMSFTLDMSVVSLVCSTGQAEAIGAWVDRTHKTTTRGEPLPDPQLSHKASGSPHVPVADVGSNPTLGRRSISAA